VFEINCLFGIDHNIFVIEQDGAKQFNRGMLLNIGFKYALEHKCDYVVFHDIDMIPSEVDYSYSDKPLHLSTNFEYENDEKEASESGPSVQIHSTNGSLNCCFQATQGLTSLPVVL
jgi:hypothetical protein